MTYKSRDKTESRAPSAGVATRPIGGLGKLDIGKWKLEVLTVVRRPSCVEVALEATTGHVHYERVLTWPRALDEAGTKLEGVVMPGPGFALERDVKKFRGVDAQTREALTAWTVDAAQVYNQLVGRGLRPASTQLDRIKYAELDWVHLVTAGDAAEAAPAHATDPQATD